MEGDLQHLHYASDHELDNILSEYVPDAPQEPVSESEPSNGPSINHEAIASVSARELQDEGITNFVSDEVAEQNIGESRQRLQTAAQATIDFRSGRINSYDYLSALGFATGEGSWLDNTTQESLDNEAANQVRNYTRFINNPTAVESAPTPEAIPAPTPEPAEAPQDEVLMPTGVNPVGSVAVPQKDGSLRTFTVGKNAEGENVVIDDRGFMWSHDGNGEALQPYSPGANVPTWTDEQLAKLGAVQPINEPQATVANIPETVPNSTETPQNSTENAVSNAESVPNPAAPVENVQETPAPTAEPTPLQRIPRDAKGEPIFEQAENPEHGWDALVEFAEGDAATAKEIADTMAEEKRKAYEKAQKQKPKGKTPTEILASKKAISAGLAQAEQEYNLWQQMANVEQRRQDAIRAQQEAEARQRAAERAEAEKAEREAREEAARLEREALEGIPEWHLDTPENARKRGTRRFSGQMFTRQEPVQGVVGHEVEVKFSQKDLPKV